MIAAGNAGGDETVGSPASADAALAVGAVDRDDQLADFSSRGPRVGDDAIKPDITAPGVDIVAARAAHDVIGGPAPVEGYVDPLRHLDGHPARGRRRGDPGPAAPGLDRRSSARPS